MTLVQRQNPVGQLLSSNSMLTANNRNVAARFMDTQTRSFSNLAEWIRPSQTLLNTSPSVFDLDGDNIVIYKAGIYSMNWQITAYATDTTTAIRAYLAVEPFGGSSWINRDGATTYKYLMTGADTLSMTGEFHFEYGDYLRVFIVRNAGSGTITIFGNRTYLGITCLYQLGDA